MNNPVKLWRNQKYVTRSLGKVGKIISWTMIHVTPTGFNDQAPYPVALIDMGDHRIITQLVDHEENHLVSGQRVQLIVRRNMWSQSDEVIPYGLKAKPLDTNSYVSRE